MKEPINIADWTVHRSYHDLRRVAVLLDRSTSPAAWLAKLRRLLPEFLSAQTPADLLDQVRKSGRIELGTLDGRIAWGIQEKLRQHGYEVPEEDASMVSYLAVHLVGDQRMALIIEDDKKAEAFCLDLIAKGAVVVPSEG